MNHLDLPEILKATECTWEPVSTFKEVGSTTTVLHNALTEFYESFEPEWTLATLQSGLSVLSNEQSLPKSAHPLLLEGFSQSETRVLRYLSGQGWRVTTLNENAGTSHAAEEISYLATGEAGDGPLKRLTYRRYWALSETGSWSLFGQRLSGVTA